MTKKPAWWLAGIFGALLIPSYGFAQSGLEVLEKMIEAQGGRRALEKISDTTISGSMELIQKGLNGTMSIRQKEPDKIRFDTEIMGMILTQAYDGEKAWMADSRTGENKVLPESMAAEFKRQAIGNSAFLYPEKFGIQYASRGREKVGDMEYVLLEQTLADGTATVFYLDPATYLVSKTKATIPGLAGTDVQAETLFSDYRQENDILMAHSLTVLHDGTEFLKLTIFGVEMNSDLPDECFRMEK